MPIHKPPPRFLHRRPIEVPEAAAEPDEVIVRELLAAKEHHEMIEPYAMDRCEIVRREVPQVHALDLRSQRFAGRYCWNRGSHLNGPLYQKGDRRNFRRRAVRLVRFWR